MPRASPAEIRREVSATTASPMPASSTLYSDVDAEVAPAQFAASSGLSKSIRAFGNAGEPQSTVLQSGPAQKVRLVELSIRTTAAITQRTVQTAARALATRIRQIVSRRAGQGASSLAPLPARCSASRTRSLSEVGRDEDLWMGFHRPLRSDWAFWVAVGLAIVNLGATTIRYEGPWTSADVATAIVFIPVTWFVAAAMIGIPVGIVRGYRQGVREGREGRTSRRRSVR